MRAKVGALELEYETFGEAGAPPIVLVQGFAQQMIRWDERFCAQLAELGFRVVRFDNRDVGLSTKLESAPLPDLPAIFSGDLSSVAYSIEDMSDDVAGLIEVLGLGAAHVVGISMGGMIAQALAIRHPARVRSLASIMSTTGDRSVGRPSSEALAVVMRPPSRDRETNIEGGVVAWRALRSPGYPFDEQAVRAFVARAFDRCFYPKGAARQMAAIGSQRDRTEGLRRIVVDTVVLHGAEDPLVHVSGGEATARAIEGARLVVVPGMGHDMPAGVWPIVLDAIATNAART